MADITYNPKYVAPFYRDNVDLVSAESPNGFNVQFSALQSEFGQLSQVVKQLNDAVQASRQRSPVRVTRTLMPVLATTSAVTATAPGWLQRPSFVEKGSQTSVQGVMTLDLPVLDSPNKITINTFRATGRNGNGSGGPGSGNLRISLQRQNVVVDVANPANNKIDTIVFLSPGIDPFDIPGAVSDPTAAVVKADSKYFIQVQLDNAQPSDIVQISAFQIIYTVTMLDS